MSAHLNYRAAGESRKGEREPVSVSLPKSHEVLLQLLTDYMRKQHGNVGMTAEMYAGELLMDEMQDRFESITGMRLGEVIAESKCGVVFEWRLVRGELVLARVSDSPIQ